MRKINAKPLSVLLLGAFLWPHVALAKTSLSSYSSSMNRFEEGGCRSLEFASDNDKDFVLRIFGCEFRVMETLPESHPGSAIIAEFRANRLGKAESGEGGHSRTFSMIGGLIDARVHEAGVFVPADFQCREDVKLTFMTLENHHEPDGSDGGMGITISQLDWANGRVSRRYERTFYVAGILKDAMVDSFVGARACLD